MKKILFLSLFISLKMFGQSVTILPQTINKQNSNIDDLQVTSYGKSTSIVGLRANGTVQAKTGVLLGNLLMKIEAAGYDGSYGFFSGGRIAFKATQNWGLYNGAAITFETTSNLGSSPTERMIINHDGNVGIGTNTPLERLQVVGNIRASSLAGTGNKQLYSDTDGTIKFSNQVAFAVHNLVGIGDISVADQTYLTVPFTSKDYDFGGNFNTSTYQFTAPVKGIYHFDVQVSWVTATNSVGNFYLQLEKNGSYMTVYGTPLISGQFASNTVSTDIDLEIGDVVKAVVYQDSGATQKLQGFNRLSRFSGRLVMTL